MFAKQLVIYDLASCVKFDINRIEQFLASE